jgi:hypothetical protein
MNLERLFLGEATLAEHHVAQTEHRATYIATLLLVLAHGVDLSTAIRALELLDILGRMGVAGSSFPERVSVLAQSLRDSTLTQATQAARQLLSEGR